MKSIEIGKSRVVASQAALGVMRMDALEPAAAATVVRTVADRGVNFFDTADIYGFNVNSGHASSRAFGRAWQDAGLRREDIFIQTKFGINIDFADPGNIHAIRCQVWRKRQCHRHGVGAQASGGHSDRARFDESFALERDARRCGYHA